MSTTLSSYDSTLIYFSLTENQDHQIQWQETELEPELHVKYSTCIEYDGRPILTTHLVFSNPQKIRNRIFVGMPRVDYFKYKNKPDGFFISKQINESQKWDSVQSTEIIINRSTLPQEGRFVTKTYSVPQNCPKLKSMTIVDLYIGVNWEFTYSFNSKTYRYQNDSNFVSKSTLSAVYASGDTVELKADSAYWNGWLDGGGEIFGTYTLPPQFSDLNGDGRMDLFVETRAGTIIFIQREDGTFQKQD